MTSAYRLTVIRSAVPVVTIITAVAVYPKTVQA